MQQQAGKAVGDKCGAQQGSSNNQLHASGEQAGSMCRQAGSITTQHQPTPVLIGQPPHPFLSLL
jgi:hypothetical protein